MVEEKFNGWTNRETWAAALWMDSEEFWQNSCREMAARFSADTAPWVIEDTTREHVEGLLNDFAEFASGEDVARVLADIGSLWRINWLEIGLAWAEEFRGGETK